jgi:hypothetical protein
MPVKITKPNAPNILRNLAISGQELIFAAMANPRRTASGVNLPSISFT